MAEKIIPEAKSRSRLLSFIKEYKDQAGFTPSSPTGSVQFNVSGSFSGSAAMVWAPDASPAGSLGIGDGSAATPKINLDVNHGSAAWLSSNTGGGESVTFGTGTTTAGKLYYLHTGSAAWKEANAQIPESGSYQILAIALGTDASTNGMLIRGFYHMSTYLEGTFLKGARVWMGGDAAGSATVDKLTAAGTIVRQVGYCLPTRKIIYFNPSTEFAENP